MRGRLRWLVAFVLFLFSLPSSKGQIWRELSDRAESLAVAKVSNYPLARDLSEQALSIAEAQYGKIDTNVAFILYRRGRYDGINPEQYMRRALEIREQLLPPDNVLIAHCLDMLGGLLNMHSSFAEAEPLLVRARAIYSLSPEVDRREVMSGLRLAESVWNQARLIEAEKILRDIIKSAQEHNVDDNTIAICIGNLGTLYTELGRYKDAEDLLRRALVKQEQAIGKGDARSSQNLTNLTDILFKSKKYSEAEVFARQTISVFQSVGDSSGIQKGLTNLANVLMGLGRNSEAEGLLIEALRINGRDSGLESQAEARVLLADIYLNENKYESVDKMTNEALEICLSTFGFDHLRASNILQFVARTHRVRSQFSEALVPALQAFEICNSHYQMNLLEMSEWEASQFSSHVISAAENYLSAFLDERTKDSTACANASRCAMIVKASISDASIRRNKFLLGMNDTTLNDGVEQLRNGRTQLIKSRIRSLMDGRVQDIKSLDSLAGC